MSEEIVCYDLSTSAYDIRVRCPECAEGGEPVQEGTEWGAYIPPHCDLCGKEIEGLNIINPRKK